MLPFSLQPMVPGHLEKGNTKFDPPARCPHCGERCRIIRHGSYHRYRFESSERIAVPRFRCRNPDCPRKTFSIPPHPYLPCCRIPLCILMALYQRHVLEKQRISACARWLGKTWNMIKRAVNLSKCLILWFRRETITGTLPAIPCADLNWPAVTRAYSYTFLPGRL